MGEVITPERGSFFENEVLTVTGEISGCHFYDCRILIKGPCVIADCTFGSDRVDSLEVVGEGVVIRECLFAPGRGRSLWGGA